MSSSRMAEAVKSPLFVEHLTHKKENDMIAANRASSDTERVCVTGKLGWQLFYPFFISVSKLSSQIF